MQYHIEKNTVQETLVIPLYARKICSEHFPALFSDPAAERLCDKLDYDFAAKAKTMESAAGLFGALEVAQRQYDLQWEVEDYLKTHPNAAVVNLGCGLDGTFRRADNGTCRGYNLDLPDVIAVRNELLPAGEREENIACDLNDVSWMDKIDGSNGAVFFAAGVFYYFKTEQVRALFCELARRFPSGVLAFDSCNRRGAKMMTKTWLKEAGITDVGAYFSLDDPAALSAWSLGKTHGFYDGMMLGAMRLGRWMLKHVWNMTRDDALEYQAMAFEPIPADFSAKETGIKNVKFLQGDVGALTFETVESLQTRLAAQYSEAKVQNVQAIATFRCVK